MGAIHFGLGLTPYTQYHLDIVCPNTNVLTDKGDCLIDGRKKPMKRGKKISGSCLCGNVEFSVTGPFLDFTFCHCGRCRKAVGSAHSAHLFVDPKQLKWISGENETTLFLHPGAEDYPRRFCNRCGSPVPRLARDGVRMVIPAGALDSDPGLRPTKNIFWSLRAPWSSCKHGLATFAARASKK